MVNYEIVGNMIIATLENGKTVKIGKAWAEKTIEKLDTNMEDVVLMYLEDEGYINNPEQDALDTKAKANKSNKIIGAKSEVVKKTPKERVQKDNPTKEKIIQTIYNALQELDTSNLTIENKGKIITFTLDNEDFKIDLTQKRKPKVK